MKGTMSHKSFFIAVVISLFFHLLIMTILFDMPGFWKDQEKRKQPIISTKLIFVTSNSFARSVESLVGSFFYQDKENINNILAEDLTIAQDIAMPENVDQKIVKKDGTSFQNTKEKISKQSETLEKMEKESLKEGNNDYEKEIFTSPPKNDRKTIQSEKNTEPSKENFQNDEKFTQFDNEKENEKIVDEHLVLSEEEKEINLSQFCNSEIKQENENNTPKQQEIPLDLTQNNFSGSMIIPPEIITFYPPEYSESLRRRGIEGSVLLKVLISSEGRVVETEIYTSSGYQAFDQAAMQSVDRWQFKPAQSGNKNRDSRVLIPVLFRLK